MKMTPFVVKSRPNDYLITKITDMAAIQITPVLRVVRKLIETPKMKSISKMKCRHFGEISILKTTCFDDVAVFR